MGGGQSAAARVCDGGTNQCSGRRSRRTQPSLRRAGACSSETFGIKKKKNLKYILKSFEARVDQQPSRRQLSRALEGFETACSQTPTHPVSFPLFH